VTVAYFKTPANSPLLKSLKPSVTPEIQTISHLNESVDITTTKLGTMHNVETIRDQKAFQILGPIANKKLQHT
jgi:hypothetical protein